VTDASSGHAPIGPAAAMRLRRCLDFVRADPDRRLPARSGCVGV